MNICGVQMDLKYTLCLSVDYQLKCTDEYIWCAGGWEEFHSMREEVQAIHPQCQLIMIGLSMGANIVLKYLGERPDHQIGIVCAFSICQGYNINE